MSASRSSHRAALCGLIGALVLVAVRPATAQLTLAPPIREVSLRSGASVKFPLRIANGGRSPVTCEMAAEDMMLGPAGRPQTAPQGYARGAGRWVAFAPARFTLAPGASQEVACALRVPRGSLGGYYARLRCLVTPGGAAGPRAGTAVTLQFQLGAVLLVTVTGGHVYSKIEARSIEFSTHLRRTDGNPPGGWAARVAVRNTGNLHSALEGEIRVLEERGTVVARAPLRAGRGFVLAGGERVFEASGPERLPDGTYAAVATLNPPGRRASPTTVSGLFTLFRGEAHRGEPTPEMRALLKSLRPLFHIERSSLHFSLPPGGRLRETVQILSLADRPVELKVQVRDWELDTNGDVVFPRDGPSHARSCAGWISVEPAIISLSARGRTRVSVSLALPRHADGDHYAAVTFSEQASAEIADAPILAQSSVLVRASALRTGRPAATVVGFSPSALTPQTSTFRLEVKNIGNVECFAQGRAAILDSRRRVVVENLQFGGQECTLLPNGLRAFNLEWQGGLPRGAYVAVVSLTYHQGAPAVSKELGFNVPAAARGRA